MSESDPTPMFLAGAPGTKLTHLSAAGSTLIKSGAGALISINVNTASANATLTVYDNISAAAPIMAVVDCSRGGVEGGFAGWPFTTGLFVVLVGTPDVTLISR
jgi:hypothetical protein